VVDTRTESNLNNVHRALQPLYEHILKRSFACVKAALDSVRPPPPPENENQRQKEFMSELEDRIDEMLLRAKLNEGETIKFKNMEYKLIRYEWFFGNDDTVKFNIDARAIVKMEPVI
jgi:hypothetical protein